MSEKIQPLSIFWFTDKGIGDDGTRKAMAAIYAYVKAKLPAESFDKVEIKGCMTSVGHHNDIDVNRVTESGMTARVLSLKWTNYGIRLRRD